MAVTDRKVHKDAAFARKLVQAYRDTIPASQTDLKIGIHRPAHPFQIEGVEVFCSALTGTVSVQVKIGTVSVLNAVITPVAATRVAGVLSSVLANLRGTDIEDINIEVTTAAASTLDDVTVSVKYRPQPLNGEIYSS